MSTTDTKEQILVWTKTERAGDVVTVDGIDGEFTMFTDGSRIYTNLLGEMTIQAKDLNDAKQLAKPFAKVADVDFTAPVELNVEEPLTTPKRKVNDEVNVMLEMLKKLSAKNTITMPLNLNIPSQEVYELFKDQMDITKADLNEQILLLIMSQIDNLQEQLKPQAEEFINNYYNGRKSTKSTINATSKSTTGSGPDITY